MEHYGNFSTDTELFTQLFKIAPLDQRINIISRLSQIQTCWLLKKGLLTEEEQSILKTIYPRLFKSKDFKEDEKYEVACDTTNSCADWIMKVKNLTQDQFDKWFDLRMRQSGFCSYNLMKWMIKRGLTDSQLDEVVTLMHDGMTRKPHLLNFMKECGYNLTIKQKAQYLHRNSREIERDPDFPKSESHEILKYILQANLCLERANLLDGMLGEIESLAGTLNADQFWFDILSVLIPGYGHHDCFHFMEHCIENPASENRLEVKEKLLKLINEGRVTYDQISDIGLDFLIPPSEKILMCM